MIDTLECVCGFKCEVDRPDEDEAWDCPQCGAYHYIAGTCPNCSGWAYDPGPRTPKEPAP